ncbi:MAG: hypothetical protein ACOCUU_00540 [Nanoarchaeota archaeon]
MEIKKDQVYDFRGEPYKISAYREGKAIGRSLKTRNERDFIGKELEELTCAQSQPLGTGDSLRRGREILASLDPEDPLNNIPRADSPGRYNPTRDFG